MPGFKKFICANMSKVLFCKGVPLRQSLLRALSRIAALATLLWGFNCLAFIENDVVKSYVYKLFYIAAQRSISGNNDVYAFVNNRFVCSCSTMMYIIG